MKNDCLDEQILWEYLDQELDPETTAKIEAHLKGCTCCEKALAEVQDLDGYFLDVVKFCNEQEKSAITASFDEMPQPMYYQHKRLVWTILTLLTFLSFFAALLFVALVAPDISALPFSGEFKYIKSLGFKTLQFFLNSSLLLGIIFLGLFIWNISFNKST